MAWIELHQSLWTHKKTFLLASELGIREVYAAAHLAHLWCWALDNAQDGSLSGLPNRVIAFGADWDGDSDVFVSALVKSGWLDETEDGYYLHDWYDYAGRLIEKKKQNKERMRQARAKKKQERDENVQSTCDAHATNVQGLPNLTIPNQTKPIEKEKQAKEKESSSSNDPKFGELIRLYESEGFGNLSKTVADEIGALYDGFGFEWVVEAMKTAVLQNRRTLAYVRGILQNWRAEGGMSLAESSGGGPVESGRRSSQVVQTTGRRRSITGGKVGWIGHEELQ